jgi:alkanesulfonate monooxygenase SsuD/methylene tetrahydromethanopterin reductase-like flavin-dependent oxidoreductase (luciferase family)
LRFGLLLPHFGGHASIEKCLNGAMHSEPYGFDSVWVRDHLVFTPYAMEGSDNTHFDGLQVLSAVAAVTNKLTLGTAMTIAHRHPVHLAQCFAALSRISSRRVIMGMGLGGFPHEFVSAGLPSSVKARADLVRANVEICRRLWAGHTVSYRDDNYNFSDVALRPLPAMPIPIWFGGSTPAACRRAVQLGEGWLPARITLATFEARMAYIRELCGSEAKISAGVMPLTSVGRNREEALRDVDIAALLNDANRSPSWAKPPGGKFSSPEDLRGMVLAGSPEEIVRDVRLYEAAGAELVIFDLRFRFAEWLQQIAWLGKEVLPEFQ